MMFLKTIALFMLLFSVVACSENQTSQPLASSITTSPEWVNLAMTNARTGTSFTLADLAGKTVFVEPMAVWCTNCRSQQTQVMAAMQSLGREDYIFISLSVEPVTNEALADYAQRNGFEQEFVVASPELLEALTAHFGRTITNPPSTPHFTIAPNGTVSALATGLHRSAELVTELQALAG